MNLKYYLRGLGIGIIVTAIIMGIVAGKGKETLSDSEIIERAKALGMVEESTRLADAALSPEPGQTVLPEATTVPTTEPETKETPEPTPEAAPTPTPEAVSDVTEEGFETITIQINSGDGSYAVSKKLEEAGLVTSASEFDRLLYEKEYDKRIKIGTFEIPVGADAEQIAGILTGIN